MPENDRRRNPIWFVTILALLVALVFLGRALLVAEVWGGWTWVFVTVVPVAVVLAIVTTLASPTRKGR